MGDDQRLHGHAVLLHEVGDARVRVDHDLVGEAHESPLVAALDVDEVLAERPVVIADGHPDGGVGVHHLIRADDLDLVGVGVQAELFGNGANLAVVSPDELERPVAAVGDGLPGALAGYEDFHHAASFF